MTEPETARCQRCGSVCKFTDNRNPDARLLRRSDIPDGICASCALTKFLKSMSPLNMVIEQRGPDVLLAPAVHAQVEAVLRAGNADASVEEIDWPGMVAAWSLP